MESYLTSDHFDLVSPDGKITAIDKEGTIERHVTVQIDDISPAFVGFKIDHEFTHFNIKSTLAQLGIDGQSSSIEFDAKTSSARVHVILTSVDPLGERMLSLLHVGAYIGKLFTADPRRRVRDPDYLARMFGRSDREGGPLLSLGGLQGGRDLVLEKIDGHTVAFLSLRNGVLQYGPEIDGFLPALNKALHQPEMETRKLLHLLQFWEKGAPKQVQKGHILLVRTLPLHIRTVFGRVVQSLLPKGVKHTSASVLQPDTTASGDIYELFGSTSHELRDIPLEFFTLEPHREHVFFADRDQLQDSLDHPQTIFKAFETAPKDPGTRSAIFIVKGEQMAKLGKKDWIKRRISPSEFPGLIHPGRQAQMVQHYIEQQPSYPFLKAIVQGLIVSQGVLFSRYFPSPLMKKMLLSELIQNCLKGLYFLEPSQSHGDFFSHEDRTTLLDLAKFAIPIFWADRGPGRILQFVPNPDKDTGMFVPLSDVETFQKATFFGIYGSNLLSGGFEEQLSKLLQGVKGLSLESSHPLLNPQRPLALITGGGPGGMEVGNRVAKNLGILSCANIVDFSPAGKLVHEQTQNPYIEAKMTYRLDRLVERQGEFNLDFPIFLMGGIGTDFEYALEELRRKVGISTANPILLFGPPDYWRAKITTRFQKNLNTGTITGSEWVSNCFFCIQNASQGLRVYQEFIQGTLPIGPQHPISEEGFVIVE
ncbi:MAG: hypothetical protein K940chlam2_00251 [Chlamydiae bacterium]|nr:hypothetical protein [Chlamydiota bacterium]